MNYVKDPAAVLDYTEDWSQWLGTDTISSVTWTVPTGITQTSTSSTTTTATIWLSGGTIGTTYNVDCKIVTAGGRTDARQLQITIATK
ncbi:MAG: hypothetical protein KGH65_03620 [Candidatus Micrarchaeota archaeon]|nr:hypothetical protein [Candidatus Micrarchaeota archaeon]